MVEYDKHTEVVVRHNRKRKHIEVVVRHNRRKNVYKMYRGCGEAQQEKK
jgi:hypothetical protein